MRQLRRSIDEVAFGRGQIDRVARWLYSRLMNTKTSFLVTSEEMEEGKVPLVFTGGACNIQDVDGPIRNPGRDRLHAWLDARERSYFDPQIHPTTHGREYIWAIDGPQETKARADARLRVYEITLTTIASITMLEIMDDARRGRQSVVWFNNGMTFAPIGLGDRDQLKGNRELRRKVGTMVYSHLQAYVNAGRQMRNELESMLSDCPHVVFVHSFDELKAVIDHLLS